MTLARSYLSGLLAAIILSALSGPCLAALDFEGQTGVFLNDLAYTAKASSIETSAHTVDLGSLGTVSTYNLDFGLQSNLELGFTRYVSAVTGVKDQDVFQGKWQFLAEKNSTPAVAVWALNRNLTNGPNDFEFGATATKVLPVVKQHPLILDLGVRATKSLGLGLFGVGDSRQARFEGTAAVFLTKKLVLGTEFKQQIDARAWHDIALRYVASPSFNIDAGIANFSSALDSQWALALTYAR